MMKVFYQLAVLAAPGDATTPPATPATPGGQIPAIVPDFNGPGVKGLTSIGGTIAGWALVLASIAVVLGVMLAVVGPRLGFQGAKAVGMGGIIGGFAMGGVVALATPGVDVVRSWFS